ncbi:MAG: pyridoxamine 5'-phosphate oxidase family protein [Betaproteobacteria bacterium]|nr:pyridoxamine 5'-phosphate oxidase family protein [Betaproteobacteria bacterium]
MHVTAQMIDELIDSQNVSIIGSVDQNGFPNIKAMFEPRKRDGIKTFWFTTNTSSMRVAQFRANPKACIYFFDHDTFRGVMLQGSMEVCEDVATKEMIWREGDMLYYRKGVTDPDYCVLRFTASSGRYYAELSTNSFEVGKTQTITVSKLVSDVKF